MEAMPKQCKLPRYDYGSPGVLGYYQVSNITISTGMRWYNISNRRIFFYCNYIDFYRQRFKILYNTQMPVQSYSTTFVSLEMLFYFAYLWNRPFLRYVSHHYFAFFTCDKRIRFLKFF